MTELFPNINIAYGEIFLSFGALMLLMIGVFKNNSVNLVSWIAVGLIAVTLFLTVAAGSEQTYTFSNLFVADGFLDDFLRHFLDHDCSMTLKTAFR